MTTRTKSLLATLAIGAVALTAAPAMAQDYGHNRGWNNGGGARHAVAACTRVAERSARRYGYDRANVTDIRDVRHTRWGFEVRGQLNVRERGGWDDRRDSDRGWDNNDWRDSHRSRDNNDWRDSRRGWQGGESYRDRGSFSCRFERGRVVAFDIDGIRGL